MTTGTYRIIHPTLALFEEGGRHVAHTLPEGSHVTIGDTSTFNGDKLISVIWDEKTVMIFTQDLRSRSEVVQSATK